MLASEKLKKIKVINDTLTEKQKIILSANTTLELVKLKISTIISDLEKEKAKRISDSEFFNDYYEEYIEEIEDEISLISNLGFLSINYNVYDYIITNRKYPQKQELAQMCGVKKDVYSHILQTVRKKINAQG
jgi:predicted RND superfamily exporter protein